MLALAASNKVIFMVLIFVVFVIINILVSYGHVVVGAISVIEHTYVYIYKHMYIVQTYDHVVVLVLSEYLLMLLYPHFGYTLTQPGRYNSI